MNRRLLQITGLFLACLIFFSFSVDSFAAKSRKRAKKYTGVTARSAFFFSTSGKHLYGKNAHNKIWPASTVKVMTALLVLETLSLDKVVTVSNSATFVQPSRINVRPGERYKVSDLLYALLISSANDAAIALAQAVAGSEKKFVDLMNRRAKQLGAQNTRFMNSHGLPTKTFQYTTAYDMSLIFRQALKHPFFKQVLSRKYDTISSLDGRKIALKNHNKLLWKGWKKNIYGKTGYTRKARSCFVGYLQNKNDTLIIAVFGCSRRWDDIKHIVTKYGGIGL